MSITTLRFGINIDARIQADSDPVREAMDAEQLGFDVVTVHRDVLHGTDPSCEIWTLLTWLAAHTSRIRLAPNVLALPNRQPDNASIHLLQHQRGGRNPASVTVTSRRTAALDGRLQQIACARAKAARRHVAIDFQIGVIEQVAFSDQTFDGVLSTLRRVPVESAWGCSLVAVAILARRLLATPVVATDADVESHTHVITLRKMFCFSHTRFDGYNVAAIFGKQGRLPRGFADLHSDWNYSPAIRHES